MYCRACCPDCDSIGYVRDAVWDEDTQRFVPYDYRCDQHLGNWNDVCTGCGVFAYEVM